MSYVCTPSLCLVRTGAPNLMGAKAWSFLDHQSDPLVSWLGQTSGAVLSGQSAPLGSWLAPDNAILHDYPTLPVCPLAPD